MEIFWAWLQCQREGCMCVGVCVCVYVLGKKLNPRSTPKQMVGKINCSIMRKGAFKPWPWNCGSVCTVRKQLGPEVEVEETYPTIWPTPAGGSLLLILAPNPKTWMLAHVCSTVQQEELIGWVFPTNTHFCSILLALSFSFQVPDIVWNCLSCLKCTFPYKHLSK